MRTITKLLGLILVIALLTGCGGKAGTPEPTETTKATEPAWLTVDFEAVLRADAFPETDPLSVDLNRAINISDLTATADTLSFTLSAPDISQALIVWYDAQPDFDEAALESQIRTLLAGEKNETRFSLNYTLSDGVVIIFYTEESLTALSCGVRQFYSYLYDQVYASIGGGENG